MENINLLPTVCIVGRPNVGKSSLFNCLLGQRRAVIVEQSGTTRDMVEAVVNMEGMDVKLVDTGGYMATDADDIMSQVREQIFRAIGEAAIFIFVNDVVVGITPQDREVAMLLRKSGKPVITTVNKVDNDKLENDSYEFFRHGFGDVEAVSCLHRRGLGSLRKRVRREISILLDDGMLTTAPKNICEKHRIKIAVVGRPNVGKSSFVNQLLEYNRVVVSDIPGTTRDSVDTYFKFEEDEYILIDTAGIRHKRKVKEAVDTYSVMRAKDAVKRSDTVILLLDAKDGITRDDIGVLKFVEESGKACLICVNKWDLARGDDSVAEEDYKKHLLYASNELSKFPILFISAKSGRNVLSAISVVKTLNANLDFKASTPFLNKIFEKNDPSRVPISRRKRRPNFLYIIQSDKRPVEFKYFVNEPGNVLPAHIKYIENQLRANLPLKGVPIRIRITRSKKERI